MDDENKDILPNENEYTQFKDSAPSDFLGYGYSSFDIYKSNTISEELPQQPELISPSLDDINIQRKKEKKKKSVFKFCLIFLLILFIPLGIGYGIGNILKSNISNIPSNFSEIHTEKDSSPSVAEEKIPEIPSGNADSLESLSNNTISIIKNVKPSVVCITSISESQDFFNFAYENEGSGSGIIFEVTDNDIYIMTNCHVIDGAKSVSISIEESDLIEARLVGKSETQDLAVIAISKKDAKSKGVTNIVPAKLGDSDALEVGAPVIAIGNALGGGNTATTGIISTPSKELTINNTKLTVIQTDAAINPGNSGGALVNGAGEVIGINTAKLATTNVEGVGYSIPINSAKPIIESLLNKKDAPFLGVYVATISEEMSSYYDIPQTGVIVTKIIENTSAAYSDIKEGDVITSFNDQPIFTSEQLSEAVTKCKVGETVQLNIIRNKSKVTVSVKLKSNPDTSF